MYISHNGILYRWNGSHTVNVFDGSTEVDVFTLYPANGRKPTQLEICDAIARRGSLKRGPDKKCLIHAN